MTPCARCPAESSSEIVTEAGVIPVCEFCNDAVWTIETAGPVDFYEEVG